VRPNTQYARIANLSGKALQHRSAWVRSARVTTFSPRAQR
jgi:hypothetical protein